MLEQDDRPGCYSTLIFWLFYMVRETDSVSSKSRRNVLMLSNRLLKVEFIHHLDGSHCRLANLASKWVLIIALIGHRTMTIHKLHEKYGNTVQISPSELPLSSL